MSRNRRTRSQGHGRAPELRDLLRKPLQPSRWFAGQRIAACLKHEADALLGQLTRVLRHSPRPVGLCRPGVQVSTEAPPAVCAKSATEAVGIGTRATFPPPPRKPLARGVGRDQNRAARRIVPSDETSEGSETPQANRDPGRRPELKRVETLVSLLAAFGRFKPTVMERIGGFGARRVPCARVEVADLRLRPRDR
jgi:hypothetical protein